MKKLSELNNDEYIIVGDDIETGLMTKENYLNSRYFLEKIDITIKNTIKTAIEISLEEMLEAITDCYIDESYGDWNQDVYNDLKENLTVQKAVEVINEVFINHPTYWDDEILENDLLESEE